MVSGPRPFHEVDDGTFDGVADHSVKVNAHKICADVPTSFSTIRSDWDGLDTEVPLPLRVSYCCDAKKVARCVAVGFLR